MSQPKLRFPEFTEEWQTTSFSKLAQTKLSNGVFNDPTKVGSGYRLINVKDMYVDGFINEQTLTRVNIDEKEFTRNKVENGDLFFTRSSLVKEGIAYTNLYLGGTDNITFDGHLIKMRPNKMVAPIFLYYLSKTNAVRKQLVAYGNTTTMTTIGQREIASVEVMIPNIKEQQKIADFLMTVDKKIETIDKKVELLKQYKKGVMQKIFSQQILFKDEDGEIHPDWATRKLGTLVKFHRGSSLSKSDINDDGRYKCIHYGELFTEYGEIIRDVSSRTNLNTGSTSMIGDILMPTSDVTPQGLAKASSIQESGVLLGGDINILRPNEGVNSIFLSYLINHEKKKIMRLVTGTTIRHIYSRDITKVTYRVPATLVEQRKIADFLSSVDTKINTEEAKLDNAKKFKKALLQRMFI